MMFKFYQPQKKDQRMIRVICNRDSTGIWFEIITPAAKELSLGESDAREVAHKILAHLGESAPSATTPPDPALILAQRIASISKATGLKPGLVGRIIQSLRWEAEDAKALEAAAPQENQPNA
jgi:hypothetical protein